VRECIIPRNEIIAFDSEGNIHDLKNQFIEYQHSKILVYAENIDNIIGYVHLFDLFANPSDIKSVSKSVLIVPETSAANKVLNMLIEQRKSVAVVVDEFGGTAGMVTIEDLIEEIFGEIEDEYDVDNLIEKQINTHEYIFSGRLEIDYLNQEYQLNLPESEEYETLAGLIINHHQSIPQKREQIIIGPLLFTILESSSNRIDKVMLKINS
jgi:CBS domain containing-hemolysin-like protein